jgi:MFS family permease
MARQYLDVWRIPGARRLLLAGIVSRLGIGMTSLALLLLVQERTGTYTPGALASAVLALASAAAGPVAGRAADRFGPTPVLLTAAVLHPVALVALVALAGAPFGVVVAASALAGASYPPNSAAIRGAWNAITEPATAHAHLRVTAMAAETVLFEVVFILGPLGVATCIALAGPAAAIYAAALLTFAGTGVLALGQVMRGLRPQHAAGRTRGLGPLAVPAFPALLACTAGQGIAFGVAAVAVPAFATQYAGHEASGTAGALLAVWALGSATGGVWFGTRRFRAPLPRQLALWAAALAASLALFTVMPNPVALGVALAFGGAAIAPSLAVQHSLVGLVAPAGMRTEAYTWMITLSVAAGAVGSALAGVISDHAGAGPAFLLAAVAVAGTAVVAGWPRSALSRVGSPTPAAA